MRTRTYTLLTLILAAVLLLSASGVVVGEMLCLKSGRSLVKINCIEDHCCPNDQTTTTSVQEECCLFNDYSIVTDQYVQASALLLKAPLAVAIDVQLQSFSPIALQQHKLQGFITSKPPPLSGRSLLQLHHTFLI